MSFSTDLAALVANQLSRFVTLNSDQLAGQVENLDFWLGQVRHALEALDGYAVRFVRMEGGQQRYVTRHGTTRKVYDVVTETARERTPPRPRRIPERELNNARRKLLDATARFLVRCRQEDLVTQQHLAEIAKRLGLDPASLHFPA